MQGAALPAAHASLSPPHQHISPGYTPLSPPSPPHAPAGYPPAAGTHAPAGPACDDRYYSYGECRTSVERDVAGPAPSEGRQEVPRPLPEPEPRALLRGDAEEDTPVYVGWGGAAGGPASLRDGLTSRGKAAKAAPPAAARLGRSHGVITSGSYPYPASDAAVHNSHGCCQHAANTTLRHSASAAAVSSRPPPPPPLALGATDPAAGASAGGLPPPAAAPRATRPATAPHTRPATAPHTRTVTAIHGSRGAARPAEEETVRRAACGGWALIPTLSPALTLTTDP